MTDPDSGDSTSNDSMKFTMLMREYDVLNEGISRFDVLRSQVKSWMITASGGVLVVVFTSGKASAAWAGALLVAAFCLTEVQYTLTQFIAIRRASSESNYW